MKQWTCRTAGTFVAIAALLLVMACGGKQTVASRSAEAFREAQKKGVAAGGAHGGHTATVSEEATTSDAAVDHATMTGMDHSTMSSTGTMAGMDHSNMPGMQSGSSMAGMDHTKMQPGQPMAGMDHSNMPGMQHGTTTRGRQQSMAGMDHSNMHGMQHGTTATARGQQQPLAAMDHSNMPGMQPGTAAPQQQQPMAGMDHSNMPGMQHGTTATARGQQQPLAAMDHSNMPGMQPGAATDRVMSAPTTNAEMLRLRPASTLKPDPFDAAAPIAVAEAIRSVRGIDDGERDLRNIVPGSDHANPPTPAPAFRDGPAQGRAAAPAMDHSGHGQAPSGESNKAASPAMNHSQHGQTTPAAQPRNENSKPSKAPATTNLYACPMHPEVTSDQPGTCPKCGMALVKKQ